MLLRLTASVLTYDLFGEIVMQHSDSGTRVMKAFDPASGTAVRPFHGNAQ